MVRRWGWPIAALLFFLLSIRHYVDARQLRQELTQERQMAGMAQLSAVRSLRLEDLPVALEALRERPDLERLEAAKREAEAYGQHYQALGLLEQIKPAQPGPGPEPAQLPPWPSLHTMLLVLGMRLPGQQWQLNPTDQQFLKDAASAVRNLNEQLKFVQEVATNQDVLLVRHYLGLIGPKVKELNDVVEAYRAYNNNLGKPQ